MPGGSGSALAQPCLPAGAELPSALGEQKLKPPGTGVESPPLLFLHRVKVGFGLVLLSLSENWAACALGESLLLRLLVVTVLPHGDKQHWVLCSETLGQRSYGFS